MKKNVVSTLFILACSLQQFAMLRCGKNIFMGKNFAFTQEFLSIAAHYKDPSRVQVFSQLPLDKGLQDKIFQLAVEEEVDVKILLSNAAALQQREILSDMKKDGVTITIFPDWYRFMFWSGRYKDDKEFCSFKFTNSKESPSAMSAALISYYQGQRILLLAKERETLSVHNGQNFFKWQQNFDSISKMGYNF
ncbi:hypothetical protein HYV10_04380 [Candidatus Dependentiae bacterium]|nr:hypothetical protein [Candidatus Dependentiae bacterium]